MFMPLSGGILSQGSMSTLKWSLPFTSRRRTFSCRCRFDSHAYQLSSSGEYCHVTRKHALSLLFMIFALATLYDPKMPPYSAEAQEYYLLARIALRWAPPAYDTTLAAIQSLVRGLRFS